MAFLTLVVSFQKAQHFAKVFTALSTFLLPFSAAYALPTQDASKVASSLFREVVFYDHNHKPYHLREWAKAHNAPVMIVAWAKWCSPCLRELPSVQKLKELMGPELTVLAMAIEPPPLAEPYHVKDVSMPLFYSQDLPPLLSALGIENIPAMVLFAPDGTLLHYEVGAKDWAAPHHVKELRQRLKKAASPQRFYKGASAPGSERLRPVK